MDVSKVQYDARTLEDLAKLFESFASSHDIICVIACVILIVQLGFWGMHSLSEHTFNHTAPGPTQFVG